MNLTNAMSPKFSIIIPVYNVAPYLRECLDSVLAQTYTDWEAICVDDGSTDESGAILDEYSARDARFRVIHNQNAGVSAARNKALESTTGEWLLFLDADDKIADNMLQPIISAINLNLQKPEMVIFAYKTFDGEGKCSEISSSGVIDVIDDLDKFIPFSVVDGALWCRCYKRSLVGNIKFSPISIGEDRVFCANVVDRITGRVIRLDSELYYYRSRGGSAMSGCFSKRKVSDHIDYEEAILKIMSKSSKRYANDVWLGYLFSATAYTLSIFKKAGSIGFCIYLKWSGVLLRLACCRMIPMSAKVKLALTALIPSVKVASLIWLR